MNIRCRLFGHRWDFNLEVGVFLNPDPHPHWIEGTTRHIVQWGCGRKGCGEVRQSKDYEYWKEQGFQDLTSYRFHDNPKDVEEFERRHGGCNRRA